MPICEYCNKKKTPVLPYTCKCGYKILCNGCRLAELHNCNYDYKMEGKNQIIKNNPIIVTPKIIIL